MRCLLHQEASVRATPRANRQRVARATNHVPSTRIAAERSYREAVTFNLIWTAPLSLVSAVHSSSRLRNRRRYVANEAVLTTDPADFAPPSLRVAKRACKSSWSIHRGGRAVPG